MKLKPYKIIFSLLVFLGLFLSLGNISLASGVGTTCGSKADCDGDLICQKGDGETIPDQCAVDPFKNNSTQTTKSGDISFTPQIPFGQISGKMNINGGTIGFYITEVYKYAVGVVGILASIVIMWGGVRWLTAGGNGDAVKDAQAWIKGALSGLVLVMTSYVILNFVNPDLTSFKLITITPIEGGQAPSTAGRAGGAVGDPCKELPTTNNAINFSTDKKLKPDTRCDAYDSTFAASAANHHIDVKLLKAIAMAESSCDPNAQSQVGACGLMQLMSDTALHGCSYLKLHPEESIDIAAAYLENHKNLPQSDLIAGYNTGYGPTSINGKKASLADSNDCPGKKAYECCTNPGGLADTQKYVYRVTQLVNGQ